MKHLLGVNYLKEMILRYIRYRGWTVERDKYSQHTICVNNYYLLQLILGVILKQFKSEFNITLSVNECYPSWTGSCCNPPWCWPPSRWAAPLVWSRLSRCRDSTAVCAHVSCTSGISRYPVRRQGTSRKRSHAPL